MTYAPLFIESVDRVKELLRLREVAPDSSSDQVVEQAVRDADVYLWQRLGKDRVAEIKAYDDDEMSLLSDDQVTRHLAQAVELALAIYYLVDRLPVGFKEGQAEFIDSRSNENAFRILSQEEVARFRDHLMNDPVSGIDARLAVLSSGVADVAGQSSVQTYLSGPEDASALVNTVFDQIGVKHGC